MSQFINSSVVRYTRLTLLTLLIALFGGPVFGLIAILFSSGDSPSHFFDDNFFFTENQLTHSSKAIAIPLGQINLDGDLTDWPTYMPTYEINTKWSNPVVDLTGRSIRQIDSTYSFHATFGAGYRSDEGLLFVAVEVQDDSLSKHDANELHIENPIRESRQIANTFFINDQRMEHLPVNQFER